MKALAIILWVLAWVCVDLIPAAFFAARDGNPTVARTLFATGILGAAGFALAGVVAW